MYAAAEGLDALVIEREAIGGQAGTSSRIRNYLGFARGVSGAELAQRAYQQAWVFGAGFLLMKEVTGSRSVTTDHTVTIADGTQVTGRASCSRRASRTGESDVPEIEALVGSGVFYGSSVGEAQACAGKHVFVVGGGNSAGQAALYLARHAARVTILVRGASLAASMSQYLRDEIDAARARRRAVPHRSRRRRRTARASTTSCSATSTPATDGRSRPARCSSSSARAPTPTWLPDAIGRDDAGYVLTGARRGPTRGRPGVPAPYETSVPGIFAVGDVRARSVKRVASAVGEGSVVIQQVTNTSPSCASSPVMLRPWTDPLLRIGVICTTIPHTRRRRRVRMGGPTRLRRGRGHRAPARSARVRAPVRRSACRFPAARPRVR